MTVRVWSPFGKLWWLHHYTENKIPLRHPDGSAVITREGAN